MSPTGSATGAGTISDPWDLWTAFAGGNPGGTIQPGDTVWLRGGTYLPRLFTADMQGTGITKVVTIAGSKRIKSSTNPWAVGDVGKSITIYGAGTGGADFTNTISIFENAGSVQLTNEVPAGTQWSCSLNGAAGAYIKYTSYPGEKATLDGNYDSDSTGNINATLYLTAAGSYRWIHNIELTNSQPNRWSLPGGAPPDARSDSVIIAGKRDRVTNCVPHDDGQAATPVKSADGWEFTGNVCYYNGYFSYAVEPDCEADLDLIPAGGSAVVATGSAATGSQSNTNSLTFAFNHTGDCVVVAVTETSSPDDHYTDLSVTYGGVAMTRVNGQNNPNSGVNDGGPGIAAIFALSNGQGAVTGTHDVVVTYAPSPTHAAWLRAIAYSFNNVHQTTPAASAGGWKSYVDPLSLYGALPPFYNRVTTSATNHLVVGATSIYNGYIQTATLATYAASGTPATEIASVGGSPNSICKMTTHAGSAQLDMGWTWTPLVRGHGHGIYPQHGARCTDAVANASDQTLTSASNPWTTADVGKLIAVDGAGAGGGRLITTILSRTSAGSIEMAAPAQTNVSGTIAKWASRANAKNNIFISPCGQNCISAQGTSDGIGLVNTDASGNLAVYHPLWFGGSGGDYDFPGTDVHENYTWETSLQADYHTDDFSGLTLKKNYIYHDMKLGTSDTWGTMVVGGSGDENTFIGALTGFTSSDFPDNNYYALGSPPTTNKIVLVDDLYEENRAFVYVYNWENATSVNVDLSSVVASGTSITIRDAQNYFGASVYSGVYSGGTVSLPMTGLTRATAVGEPWPIDGTPEGPTGQPFNVFVVRATSWGW